MTPLLNVLAVVWIAVGVVLFMSIGKELVREWKWWRRMINPPATKR